MLPKRKVQAPKQQLFTEEDIRRKAYELWKARTHNGIVGSAEDDWNAAVEVLKKERSVSKKLSLWWKTATNTSNRAFSLEVVKTCTTIFAGVGLFLTYYNTRQEQQLNTERLITDRFSKAVEQLGNSDIEVRIGGIYSLERIAKDSPKDHPTIIEVLTAFIRDKFSLPTSSASKQKAITKIPTDIQSALTVIGRRDVTNDSNNSHLDLDKTNLGGANLGGAYLIGANLTGAYLNGAYLYEANLNKANLYEANLNKAYLYGANLTGANLTGAKLNEASLFSANLNRAYLNRAKLNEASLFLANLNGAYLNEANLNKANLTGANLTGANLIEANLTGASLYGANLTGANLTGAYLNEANLNEANLNEANLTGANLTGANLDGAYLTGACLKQVRALTPKQVQKAQYWQDAYYSPDFRKRLGLPRDARTPPSYCR